jgi:hypothetical protein
VEVGPWKRLKGISGGAGIRFDYVVGPQPGARRQRCITTGLPQAYRGGAHTLPLGWRVRVLPCGAEGAELDAWLRARPSVVELINYA